MKKQALISCSDKSGVVEFAKALTELGYHILSTGGTAKLIAQAGIPVQEVADYTGFRKCLTEESNTEPEDPCRHSCPPPRCGAHGGVKAV
ncbi:MAG: hypothetical protein ACLRRK_02955 [Parasutterella sp.]